MATDDGQATSTGHCLGGAAVTYSFSGEPAMQALCHCDDCQRASGTTFAALVGVERSALPVSGDALTSYKTTGEDTGQGRERFFCGTCGSPVMSVLAEMPDIAFVKAGTLDDRSIIGPELEVWTTSAQPWLQLAGEEARGQFPRGLDL